MFIKSKILVPEGKCQDRVNGLTILRRARHKTVRWGMKPQSMREKTLPEGMNREAS